MSIFLKRMLYVFCCITLIFLCGFDNRIDNKTKEEINRVIVKYFDGYYGSLKSLELQDMSNIIEVNDQTYMYRVLNELEIEKYKALNLGYSSYTYHIRYNNVANEKDKIKVELSIDLEYKYKNIPKDITSSMNNIEYLFYLKNVDSCLKICSIATDFDEYREFKELVNEKTSMRGSDGRKSGIDEVKNIMLNRYKKLKPVNIKYEDIELRNEFREENNFINSRLGVAYATEYALKPIKDRLFYTAEGDCTNFVSQCVWASIGGYDPMNNEDTKDNINRQKGMVKGLWLGNAFGGTTAWENVEEFWRVATNANLKGPKAKGINNNKSYLNLKPENISVGTVLQVRKRQDNRYKHSAYVTYVNKDGNTDYGDIFISQHSYDKYNRSLVDLIISWGGEDCYIRGLNFYNFIK